MKDESFRPNRMLSYFQEEWKILFFVTVSGLIYNLGLLAGPWFEGKMTGKLVDLLGGTGTFHQMLMLVTAYVVSIGIVQVSRYFKRFYVRRFANNVNRHMKQILYGTLVRKSRLELEAEGTGNILTKAILDVDGNLRYRCCSSRLCVYAALVRLAPGSSLHDFPTHFLRDCRKDEGHGTENGRCL